MTLEWTTIDIPLGAGLDTKTNEKLLKPPFAADLSDAVFPASGIDGYETRKGYDRIRTETSLANIDSLATRENELVVLGGNNAYSMSERTDSTDLIALGELLAVEVQQETLDTQAVNQTLGQVITKNNIQVHCWLDSGTSTIQYTTIDAITGARISSDNSIANSTRAKLAYTENSILLIYFNSSTTAIRCTVIPTYAPTSTTDVELRSDAHADALFDCMEVDSTYQKVYVAYKHTNGETDGVTTFLVDESGVVTHPTVVLDPIAAVALAVAVTAYRFCVAVATATNVNIYNSPGYPTAIGTFTANNNTHGSVINLAYTAQLDSTVADGSEKHYLWAETAGASAQFNLVDLSEATGVSNLDTSSPTATMRQCSLASNAFLIDNKGFVHVAYDTTLQRQYFLLNALGEVHAKCCVGIGAGNITPHLPRVVDYTWAPVFRERLQIDVDPDIAETPANVFAQYGLKKVTYDLAYRPVSVEYGKAAYINSGILWQYDGRNLVEQGFNVYPEGITSAESNTGSGALTLLGSYSYRVYYEWTNARGERQRSTTGEIHTFNNGAGLTGANDTITLTIPTLSHSKKGTDVSIVVYRTESNPNLVGGAPLYRVSSTDPESTTPNNYVANDPTVNTVTFVDALADTVIITHELDYLNSGELDHVSPFPADVIGEAKNRVWLAGFELGNRVQYSKLNSRGRDQLEFHDTQVVDLPEGDGPVTAFGALNFHAVAFKENSCYAISGEGPNNLGGGFFNLPQIVSLDVGCIEPRSVVSIPQGILFKSNKGIWRLGHNLDMQYVGAKAEGFNDQDITSATIIPEENHVLFLTSSGSTLVYNYLVDEWSRFTNHAGNSAVVWNGTYTYARTDGRIYRQSDTNYADDGVHYAMKFTTAPIGIKGAQGKQRIKAVNLLGRYYSPHELRLGLRYNHEPGVSDTGTWNPTDGITVSVYGAGAYGAGAYGGDGSPVYQARFNLPRQKCQAVQFVIDTTNTSSAGRAMSIQALQIKVGAKEGLGSLSVDRAFSATGGSTAE